MSAPLKYRTIMGIATSDFRDRGSKFLGYAYGVKDLVDIKARIAEVKSLHPKATHHCLAWRLGTDGTQFRAADAGEPAGSAGRPILGAIDSAELTNVLVAVVRYFGGSLLGVPGLINAYRTAAADALSAAKIVEYWAEDKITITFDYPSMGEVLYIIKGAEATIYRQDLQLFCTIEAGIPLHLSQSIVQQLTEIRGVEVSRDKS